MSDTGQKAHISRRTLLKVLVAAGGSVAASAIIPGKWTKPLVRVGVLPVHAQTSQPGGLYHIVATTLNLQYGDNCITDPALSVVISPARAGIQMQVRVSNTVDGTQTLTATTDANGQAFFPEPNPRCFPDGNTTVTFTFVDPALCGPTNCTVQYLCTPGGACVIQ